jgi:hypothetical protein
VESTQAPIGAPAPGWYPDPEAPETQQRYWDGAEWTDQRAPYTPPPEAPAWLVGAGYVLSVTMIGGLVIGTALAARKDSNAPWVLGLSLFFITACIIIGAIEEA